MLRFVCSLSREDYRDWVQETSCLEDVQIFGSKLDEAVLSPWFFWAACLYSFYIFFSIPWSFLVLLVSFKFIVFGSTHLVIYSNSSHQEQVLVLAIAVSSATLFNALGEKLLHSVPNSVHFLFIGASKK